MIDPAFSRVNMDTLPICRPRKQLDILAEVMSDGKPHSAYELAMIVAEERYGGVEQVKHGLRIGARIWDLKNKRHMAIRSWCDPQSRQKQWYQLVVPVAGPKINQPQKAEREPFTLKS